MALWLLIGTLMLLFVLESFSLMCYQCNFCDVPFNPESANKVNCTGSCEKTQSRKDEVRLCSPEFIESTCLSKNTRRGSDRWACACNSDFCNAATTPKSTFTLISTVLVMLWNIIF